MTSPYRTPRQEKVSLFDGRQTCLQSPTRAVCWKDTWAEHEEDCEVDQVAGKTRQTARPIIELTLPYGASLASERQGAVPAATVTG